MVEVTLGPRARQIPAAFGAVLIAGALVACGGSDAPESSTTAEPTYSTTAPQGFPYQPLWPFASQQGADHWLREGAPGGHSPWHADDEATAIFFTQNYLGFTEIDRTTAVTTHDDEAWVGVGAALPNGEPHTVATIHLARFGTAPNAPWEVVGTRDDFLTLESPPYGSTVGPVIEAGGRITGVDESLHLQVRQSTQQGVLGEFCCVPGGGHGQPWSAQVPVSGTQPGVLTLVVWTGGHVAKVEEFAITALRAE